jgi:hypothetical protein
VIGVSQVLEYVDDFDSSGKNTFPTENNVKNILVANIETGLKVNVHKEYTGMSKKSRSATKSYI